MLVQDDSLILSTGISERCIRYSKNYSWKTSDVALIRRDFIQSFRLKVWNYIPNCKTKGKLMKSI